MTLPPVCTLRQSAVIDQIDIAFRADIDLIELSLWREMRLIMTIGISPENARTLASQLHTAISAGAED